MTANLVDRFDLPMATAAFLLFLVSVSGHFTYEGLALAYPNNPVLALAITVAIQGTIFLALIYLPQIQAVGRVLCFAVYVFATIFSALFAFIYLYHSGYGDAERAHALRRTASFLQAELSVLEAAESRFIAEAQARLVEKDTLVQAELESGLVSGRGEGEGPVYFRLKQELDVETRYLALLQQRYDQFRVAADELHRVLSAAAYDPGDVSRLLARLTAYCATCTDQGGPAQGKTVDDLIVSFTDRAGYLPSSFEAAFTMLMTDIERRRVWITLIQASLFDVLSLFVGLVRAMIVTKPAPASVARRQRRPWLIDTLLFLRRLRLQRLRLQRIHQRYLSDPPRPAGADGMALVEAVPVVDPDPVVDEAPPAAFTETAHERDEARLERFAWQLLSTCVSVAWRENELLEPLKVLIKKLERTGANLTGDALGVRRIDIRYNERLGAVFNVLMSHGVFHDDGHRTHYRLSRDPANEIFVDAFYRIAASDAERALQFVRQPSRELMWWVDPGLRQLEMRT